LWVGNKRARPIISAGMTPRPNRGLWSAEDIERLRQHNERGGSAARVCGNIQADRTGRKGAGARTWAEISHDQPAAASRARGDLSPPAA